MCLPLTLGTTLFFQAKPLRQLWQRVGDAGGGWRRGERSLLLCQPDRAVCPALPGLVCALAPILEGEKQQRPPPSPVQAFLELAGRGSSASTAAFPQRRRVLTAPPATTKMKPTKPPDFPGSPHAGQDEGALWPPRSHPQPVVGPAAPIHPLHAGILSHQRGQTHGLETPASTFLQDHENFMSCWWRGQSPLPPRPARPETGTEQGTAVGHGGCSGGNG